MENAGDFEKVEKDEICRYFRVKMIVLWTQNWSFIKFVDRTGILNTSELYPTDSLLLSRYKWNGYPRAWCGRWSIYGHSSRGCQVFAWSRLHESLHTNHFHKIIILTPVWYYLGESWNLDPPLKHLTKYQGLQIRTASATKIAKINDILISIPYWIRSLSVSASVNKASPLKNGEKSLILNISSPMLRKWTSQRLRRTLCSWIGF